MPTVNPDDALLLIRCPSCAQRFKVAEDLRGRTVECGGCEQRFRINDEAIVRGRKFYPGEKQDNRLTRFQRVPLAVAPPVVATPTIRYAEPPDPSTFMPLTPQRVIAGLLGGCVIVLMALLLTLGASRGGALDGIPTDKRLIMACFGGILGTVLLAYANPRSRGKSLFSGLMLTGILAGIPFVFTAGSISLPDQDAPYTDPFAEILEKTEDSNANVSELSLTIGTKPLEDEIERLSSEGSTRKAVGLWLRDMSEQNRFLIRDYILRATGADPQSHYYPREEGNFLMVVTGITLTLDEMAVVAQKLGSIENIFPEISVIEVKVNDENFVEGSIEQLTDKTQPKFYEANKRELESIDLERIERAVKRLADAEPNVYRSDISSKLLELLGMPEVKFKGEVCQALIVWADNLANTGTVAIAQAKSMLDSKIAVPEELIKLIIKSKNPEIIPILEILWQENPAKWESHYASVGQIAEPSLLSLFSSSSGSHRNSAVRLLGRVGTADSLDTLLAAKTGAESELSILLDHAISSIRSRHGL